MKKTVRVSNAFQKHYTYYLSEPMGKHFDHDFKPELSPKEMINLGVFDGCYGGIDEREFPSSWFSKNRMDHAIPDKHRNYFQVSASQPLSLWKEKGWIHPQDPKGWFQWYCRYYIGRRTMDDERQIKRWKAMKRHIAQIKRNCNVGDQACRPRQRQALLHWAYDSRNI